MFAVCNIQNNNCLYKLFLYNLKINYTFTLSNYLKTYIMNESKVPYLTLKKQETDFPRVTITSSQVMDDFVRQFFHDDISIMESFFILLLDQSNTTIGYAKISQGGIAGTVVDIRIVAHYCISALATQVILCHNHPSGNLKPSTSDNKITAKLCKGLDLLDVKVLDHLIISKDGYYSYADESNISLIN